MKFFRHPVTRFFIFIIVLFALITMCGTAFAGGYQQQISCKNPTTCINKIKKLTHDARHSIVAVGFSKDELRKLIAQSERNNILVETVTHPTVRFILIDSFIVIKGSMKFDSRPINNLGMYEIITVMANGMIGSVYLNEYLKFKR